MSFSPPNHARALFLALFFTWLYIASVVWWHVSTRQHLEILSLVGGSLSIGILVYGSMVIHRAFLANLFPLGFNLFGSVWSVPIAVVWALHIFAGFIIVGSLLIIAWAWFHTYRDRFKIESGMRLRSFWQHRSSPTNSCELFSVPMSLTPSSERYSRSSSKGSDCVMPNLVFALFLAAIATDTAEPSAGKLTSRSFSESGVIVDVHQFFSAATGKIERKPDDVVHGSVAGKALVTEHGVFAFLETPENELALAETVNGSVVNVEGKLLVEGALLHIDKLERTTTVPLIDFGRFREDVGKEVSLSGVNKCQCGLDVADLPHSCKLGHLHHLEATDGNIYNYLQFDRGQDVFLGKESHFKEVDVKARKLPGNYLIVSSVETTGSP